MLNVLKRLIIKESKEIILNIEDGEKLLKIAEENINKLKNNSKVYLLKKEIRELANNLLKKEFSRGYRSSMICFESSEDIEQHKKLIKEFEECIDELVLIADERMKDE